MLLGPQYPPYEDCIDEPTTITTIETTSTTTIETTSHIVIDTWKLLVIGGYEDGRGYISDVEKVDPNKISSKCKKPMQYPTVIYGPTAQAFPDQSVLSCGGSDVHGKHKSCYEYNPIHLNWSYATDMIKARSHSSSVLLNDNEMWVVGSTNCQSTEIYDRKTNSFRKGPDVPDVPELSNLHFHCMTKLNATHVFIGGIESMDYDVYDVSFLVKVSEEPFVFHKLPKMKQSRFGAGCGVIRLDSNNGNMSQRYNTSSSKTLIIMVGGGELLTWRSDSEIFNIEENEWSTGPMLPGSFRSGGSASLGDGSMVIAGGCCTEDGDKSDVMRLNPNLMEFETMAGELQTAKEHFAMTVLLDNEDC